MIGRSKKVSGGGGGHTNIRMYEQDAFDERALSTCNVNLIPRSDSDFSRAIAPLEKASESRLVLYYNGHDDSSIVRNVR